MCVRSSGYICARREILCGKLQIFETKLPVSIVMDGQTANFKLFIIVPCKFFFLANVNLKNYFFCLVGRKYHFGSRRPIANVVFSASLDKKIVY